jgi:hypothetical protein
VPVPVRSGSFASGLASPRAQVTKASASAAGKHDEKAHHTKPREEKEKEKEKNKQARSPMKHDVAAGETKDTKHGKAAHDDAEADAKIKKSKKNDNSNSGKKKKDDKKESPRVKSNKKDKPETAPLNLKHLVTALRDDEEDSPKAPVATNNSGTTTKLLVCTSHHGLVTLARLVADRFVRVHA